VDDGGVCEMWALRGREREGGKGGGNGGGEGMGVGEIRVFEDDFKGFMDRAQRSNPGNESLLGNFGGTNPLRFLGRFNEERDRTGIYSSHLI